jgi:hypothetical protein
MQFHLVCNPAKGPPCGQLRQHQQEEQELTMTIIDPRINILLPSSTIYKLDHDAGKTLAEVAHLQSVISKKQNRHDYFVSVSAVPLAFFPPEDGGGVAVLGNDKVKVAKSAFRQLSQYLEISGLGKILEQTAELDSTANWRGQEARAFEAANLMLRMWTQRVNKTLRWRVSSRRGESLPVLDGVVTEGYAPLSHVEALSLAVDHFGGDRNVIEYTLTTEKMRVRIADEPIELGKPIKMIEMWNSETGHASLSFWGKLWKLICSNGMAATLEDYGRSRHNHVGDMMQRVNDHLPEQLVGIRRGLGEGFDLYEQSLATRVDFAPGVEVEDNTPGPVETFITEVNAKRKTRVPDRVLKNVFERGLHDETSSPYSTLAGAVDGITRVAQGESLSLQHEMEKFSNAVLLDGIRRSVENRILVSA